MTEAPVEHTESIIIMTKQTASHLINQIAFWSIMAFLFVGYPALAHMHWLATFAAVR